jgi:hypothetical protein
MLREKKLCALQREIRLQKILSACCMSSSLCHTWPLFNATLAIFHADGVAHAGAVDES